MRGGMRGGGGGLSPTSRPQEPRRQGGATGELTGLSPSEEGPPSGLRLEGLQETDTRAGSAAMGIFIARCASPATSLPLCRTRSEAEFSGNDVLSALEIQMLKESDLLQSCCRWRGVGGVGGAPNRRWEEKTVSSFPKHTAPWLRVQNTVRSLR